MHPGKVRLSISATFLANGISAGLWSLLVPVLMRNLAIGEADMGKILLAGGLSAVAGLLASGRLIAMIGARPVILVSALFLAVTLPLLPFQASPVFTVAIVVFFFIGLALMDVAMNAAAAEAENASSRSMMSGFHAFWSLGAMSGAMAGGFLMASVGPQSATIATAVLILCLVLFTIRFLPSEDRSPETRHRESQTISRQHVWFPKNAIVWLSGLVAFGGFVGEGAVIDWAAHYLEKSLGSGIGISGFGFGLFSLSMVIGRFTGDHLREKLGDRNLLAASIALSATGMLIAGFAASPAMAFAGFFMAGFGNANLVPIAFSTASNITGVPAGAGIAAATMCGYSGILFAPATLGWIGQYAGMAWIFIVMGILVAGLILAVPAMGRAARQTGAKRQ